MVVVVFFLPWVLPSGYFFTQVITLILRSKRSAARTISLDLLNDREGVCLGDLHLNCIILSSLSFRVGVWGFF